MKSAINLIGCIALSISMLLSSGCISRASQPNLTGTVVTPELKPLSGVKVINHDETYITDEEGKFYFAESRYYAFLLKELFYMHPPPLFIHLFFEKSGYQTCLYQTIDTYGGGIPKGTTWDLDNIILEPQNTQDAGNTGDRGDTGDTGDTGNTENPQPNEYQYQECTTS